MNIIPMHARGAKAAALSTNPFRDVLTVPEAARLLCVPVRTVYDQARKGTLPCVRLGARVLILRETVNLLLDQGRPW